MDDEPGRDLLGRFVNGDGDAFEAIFRHFERDVYRWILRIVREPAAAEDAVVETFWRAYRSRARFDPARSCGAWLRRVATHAAIDQLKVSRRKAWLPLDECHVPASHGPAASGYGAPPDGATRQLVTRAFAALPPTLRVVATLALVEGESHADIADALGVPLGTVKSRLFRATRLLRAELSRLGVHA